MCEPPDSCVAGLAPWVWAILGSGTGICICACSCYFMRNVRRGNTPSTLARYAEAVMTASHSYPSENRLHGRKSGSHPRLDLLEAQDCCCCLPLQIGLMIIGAFDLTRLVNSIAYAADGIDMYTQPGWTAPADTLHLQRASLVVACPKALFWLLLPFSMCTEGTTVLSLLLVWLPIDLIYSIIFAALNAGKPSHRLERRPPGGSRLVRSLASQVKSCCQDLTAALTLTAQHASSCWWLILLLYLPTHLPTYLLTHLLQVKSQGRPRQKGVEFLTGHHLHT